MSVWINKRQTTKSTTYEIQIQLHTGGTSRDFRVVVVNYSADFVLINLST